MINLSAEKQENLQQINNLNDKVSKLKADVKTYKSKTEETRKKIEIFEYKENVLKSKYPRFADVAEIVLS